MTCSGSGASRGSERVTCGQCGGSGKVRTQQGFFYIRANMFSMLRKRNNYKNPCNPCRGPGRVRKIENYQ